MSSFVGDVLKLKKVFGYAGVSAALPVLLMGVSAPIANAATVTSTVEAMDNCVWQVFAPSSIALSSNYKYEGDPFELETPEILSFGIGLAGSSQATQATDVSDATAECSFYNQNPEGELEISLSATDLFVASYGDSNTPDKDMNILIDGSNADAYLAIEWQVAPECNSDYFDTFGWNIVEIAVIGNPQSTQESLGVPNYVSARTNVDLLSAPTPASKIFCGMELIGYLGIPGKQTAIAGAGYTYSFSGPSLVFSKSALTQ